MSRAHSPTAEQKGIDVMDPEQAGRLESESKEYDDEKEKKS